MKVNIYRNERFFKWFVIVVGLLIGSITVIYTNMLVDQLSERERKQVDFFAKVQERVASFSEKNAQDDMTFLLTEVLKENDLIPVILTDSEEHVISQRNVKIPKGLSLEEEQAFLNKTVQQMKKHYAPIVIHIEPDHLNYIFYSNSELIFQLQFAPVIQLLVLFVFGFISYFIFTSSRKAEQNQLWAGLAKETAHQLGTPISSLMAWVEYFKSNDQLEPSIIEELEKDINRLSTITARFSSIGSTPTLKPYLLLDTIKQAVQYISKRISSKVVLNVEAEDQVYLYEALLNLPLFEWVIENLCKNAVDAMTGKGHLDIKVQLSEDQSFFLIDIQDDGKGIPKSKLKTVFKAGYTTKKRGWGLGLTLVKRIIEEYHQGKIFVYNSTTDIGTTFRIILPVHPL